MIALVLAAALFGETEPVYYAYRRGGELGVAELVVNRPGERFDSHRSLGALPETAGVVAMRATNDPPCAFVLLERSDTRNLLAVDPRAAPEARAKLLSLAGAPTAITSDSEAAFVAAGSAVVRVEADSRSVSERRELGAGSRVAALVCYDDEDLVLASVSSSGSTTKLVAIDEDDLEREFELALPAALARCDLLAVSEELGYAVCGARGSAHLAIVDLEAAADGESGAVRASFEWRVPTSAMVTHSLCVADGDRPLAFVFGALADAGAAIELRTAKIAARFDAPAGLESPCYHAKPRLVVSIGGGANSVTTLGVGKDSISESHSIPLDAAPQLLVPVEPSTCVQVVALGADSLWLVRVDLERVNANESVLGLPLAAASPRER